MTIARLKRILPKLCQQDTAYDPADWSPANPLAEHCTVVSLLVQELFGGELMRRKILPSKHYPNGGWHWYNRLPNGRIIDLTKGQYGTKAPRYSPPKVRIRREVLRIASVSSRYLKLRGRILNTL